MKNDINGTIHNESYKIREYKKKTSKNGQKSIQLPNSTVFKENESVTVISKKDYDLLLNLLENIESENNKLISELEGTKKQLKDYDNIKRELEIYKNNEIELKNLQYDNQLLNKDVENLTDKNKILEEDKEILGNNINDMSIKIKESARELKNIKKDNTKKEIAIKYFQGYIDSLMARGLYARIINKEPTSKYKKPDYVKELERK